MVATKYDLADWLHETLKDLGGRGTIIDVCRHIWLNHEADLRKSGDLFFTWQYDVRWAATELRNDGIMKAKGESPKGVWELKS